MEGCVSTIGRKYKEDLDQQVKDPFLGDYLKIVQSKAYRRLAFKTQVLSLPDNPHVRTRLIHTGEVMAISIMIADALGLNKNLCMAIAAGHDIGHTPYGHLGERVLSECRGSPFCHNINGVVLAQHVERRGQGLNLTYETLEGILKHNRETTIPDFGKDEPREHAAVTYADKIAFTFSDLNDAVRYGYIDGGNLPGCAIELGATQTIREHNTLNALVAESREKGAVSFSEGSVFANFDELYTVLLEKFYLKIDFSIQEMILRKLYRNISEISDIDPSFLVSMLTDKEANRFGELMSNCSKPSVKDINHCGLFEILPYLTDKKIDYSDPDLGWKPR
ncbi:deoxyguanosinetriphosphate triphosphohydrolase [Candidatus Woesearchaeota archaeon CG10_big_fil_rev_8_21_14_0_10_44_13]|nr:MAG: deoxyguanosinetriphosphate triphosphohydrolase [Candidatus Woesearchaeota archaeon CG10_big_fil_rev_8_21_14_0_10_44_13]